MPNFNLLYIILCLLLCCTGGLTQSVTGLITDNNYIPIPGAHIIKNATDEHAHSNERGSFIISEANIGDTLHITHIGFRSSSVVIRSMGKPLNIVLSEKPISLDEIVISPQVDALNIISDIDIQISPVNTSQDILRQVPGLFIGQHAGGGKAEQIFLRGFDIDHGTDINITVDGLPVNMVSHAHGQGYADLHFLIPETVDAIDFGKGPYYADQGNFNTAGYVDFKTKRNLDFSSIKLEAGQFNTKRLVGLFDIVNDQSQHGYMAAEYSSTDGPFESSQNFNRVNLFAKYTTQISPSNQLGITGSHFTSRWDASGQIPQRAIDDGSISRFGAIDDTEGGVTSRTNIALEHKKTISDHAYITNKAFFSNYQFELYSNFTFFLEDPINGDQIRQRESRKLIGLQSDYNYGFSSGEVDGLLQAGIQLRYDQSRNNELSRTRNRRETLQPIQLGDVNETNLSTYVNAKINIGRWTINPAARIDLFDFQYNDQLLPVYSTQTASASIFSPKLNVFYNHSRNLQFYAKAGRGFHSNDTRVSVAQNGRQILPAAYGADLGLVWKPVSDVFMNAAVWYLFLEQEFVYVGDAGIVEPSGQTARRGIDLSLRYQPTSWLYWNIDANVTNPRSTQEENGQNYIPLAPTMTVASGLKMIHPSGIRGGINLRYLADRPANEDYSITAEGYTVMDLNVDYTWRSIVLGIEVQNLLNTDWNETQFATESRLQNEAQSVEEIHFTPGTPFFIRSKIEFRF